VTRLPLRRAVRRRGFVSRRATLGATRPCLTSMSDLEATMDAPTEREIHLSPGTDGMLAIIIQRVVDGRAEPAEVTAVLRRVCDESRCRPPESLVLRVKELWAKVAGASRPMHDEKDRRYFGFIGEALVLYFGSAPSELVARQPSPLHDDERGEPAPHVL
jgi:hypothetical protein